MKVQLRNLKKALAKQSNVDNLTRQFVGTYKALKTEYCKLKEKDGRSNLSNAEVDTLLGTSFRRFLKTMTYKQ